MVRYKINKENFDKYHNKEWLYQKYIIEGLSQHKIGSICHITQFSVYKWLKEFNIKKEKKIIYPYITNGYRFIKTINGSRAEHLINAEKKIGRLLKKGEVVHHINGDRLDNRLKNLYVAENTIKHKKMHTSLRKITYKLVKMNLIKFDNKKEEYYTIPNLGAYFQ